MRHRMRYFGAGLAAALFFALTLVGTALAWPDQPPDKAYISGPGIEGQVQITDLRVLAMLKLGALEDLETGPVSPPLVFDSAYKITRYYYDGTFRFADLTYYLNVAWPHNYVYWDDGPQLEGTHTPYHLKWLYTTAPGDAVMREYLHQLKVTLPGETVPETAPADRLPVEIVAGSPVTLGFTLAQAYKVAPVTLRRTGIAQEVELIADASGEPGHYTFTYTFLEPGTWNWSVRHSPGGKGVAMPPLTVVGAAANAVSPAPASAPSGATGQGARTAAVQVPVAGPSSNFMWLALLAGAVGVIGLIGAVVVQRNRP